MMVKSLEKIDLLAQLATRRRLAVIWMIGAATLLMLAGCGAKSPEELLSEGEMLLNTKQVFEAELKFQDFLDKYPDNADVPKAHFGLALCAWQDQDYQRMREQLDETIKGVGGLGDSLGFQAAALKLVSYREQKDFKKALDEALATSATLTSLPPEQRYTYNLMTAELYTMNDEEPKAIALCMSLLERTDATPPILSSAMQRLVLIHMRHDDIKGAIKVCEDYLDKHPDTPLKLNILTNIGFLYQRAGDQTIADQKLDEAEKFIQTNIDKALTEDEKAFDLISLARLQRDRGKTDAVRQTLDTIISEYPMSPYRSQAMLMRAELDVSLQKYDEAIKILENVAKDYANERPAAQAVQMIDQIRAQMQKTTGTLATTGTLGPMDTTGTLGPMGTLAPLGDLAPMEALETTDTLATPAAAAPTTGTAAAIVTPAATADAPISGAAQ